MATKFGFTKEQMALHNAILTAVNHYSTGLISDVEILNEMVYLKTRYEGMDLDSKRDVMTGLRYPSKYKL
jgi:hypothetical protein